MILNGSKAMRNRSLFGILLVTLSLLMTPAMLPVHTSAADTSLNADNGVNNVSTSGSISELRFLSTDDLSNNGGASTFTQIAVSGTNVYVVWQDTTPGFDDVFFRVSYDNGASFEDEVNLSLNAGSSGRAQIAVSGTNVYVVWNDNTPGNYDIFFRRSTDNGANFSPTVNLSLNAGFSASPQIAVSGTNVYVVWHDNTPGSFDILSARSTNSGAKFGCAVNLSLNAGGSESSQIAVSGTNVYVVWHDDTLGNNEVFFKRNVDSLPSFCPVNNLSLNAGFSAFPQIAVSGTNVYVVWFDTTPGNNDIFFRSSTDSGANFSPTVNLSLNAGFSEFPQIAVSGTNVYVVWHDNTPGNNDIFFRRSTDNGANFDPKINRSSNTGESVNPQIDVFGASVYVIWRDGTPGNYDVFFRKSTDSGANFDPFINVSTSGGSSASPQIAVSGTNVYVVWFDTTPGNNDIFFRTSINSGASFFNPVTNLSSNAGTSLNPQIAAFGNKVYVVWQDFTPVNYDIFFRANW